MNTLQTRRSFIRSTALGAAIGWTAPSFLASTFDQLHAEAAGRTIQTGTGKDSPILVVLQLAGGNDGLNTVIPFANDHYHRARPTLGLKAEQVLKLDGQFGLHPALTGLKSLYDAGQLGIVQAVGYPNPNRSHFRSTDIWMTATDSDRYGNLGWLGRYFDNACTGADPTVGVAIGRQSPLAFTAKKPTGVALENPDSYRFAEGEMDANNDMAGSTKFYREMNAQGSPTMAGDSVNMLSGSATHTGSPLDFLERTAMDAQVSSDQIRSVAAKVKNHAEYPAARLATDLKLVAKLIAGGMPTRVYYVSQGGYDTHQGQANAHPRLLTELGDSLKAFLTDLKALGQLDRVLVLTFSEFGRRVGENASGGTDHGAAAPLFVMGGKVKVGLHGEAPSLAPGDLLNGDVRFRTDFRSIYAGVLENWLHTPSEPILGRKFVPIAVA